MKKHSVNVQINDKEELLSWWDDEYIVSYTAYLTNPFEYGMRCDVSLISRTHKSDGWGNTSTVDSKVHSYIEVKARSSVKLEGKIKIKKGGDGPSSTALWGPNKGRATNCSFTGK